jgi:methyl-accepting chemotaxis protein
MHTLLNRLFLWQKFLLLAFLGTLLAAAPLILYINESDKAVDSATRSASGIEPINAVLKLVLLTQQHRGLSAMMLAGDMSAGTARAAKQKEVDAAIAGAAAAAAQTRNAEINRLVGESKDTWATLADKVAQRALPGAQSFAQHTALIGNELKAVELLIDHYGLNLDPGIDSHHLIDAVLMQSPVLSETLGRMRAKGSAALTSQSLSVDDRAALAAMLEKADERYASVRNALEKSFVANPSLRVKLEGSMQASLAAGNALLDLTRREITGAEQLSFPAPQYFAKVTETIGVQGKLVTDSMDALNVLLHAREAELKQTKYLLIGTVLVLLLAAALIGRLIVRSITAPIEQAVALAKQVAAGDLTCHIAVTSRNETGQLLDALGDMNDSLRHIVAEVRSGTESITIGSGQIAAGNADLSSRTEQQASALEETASSMEEITGTVKHNADNAWQANHLATTASEVAAKGGESVKQVAATMSEINDASKRIADIIGVIDGIAFQTNLLALNAAVEAARAGEQGRGFAVVATEVRGLAQRSAAAAKEIKELISDSVEKVDAGAKLADQAGATMDEIVASVRRVSDIVAEISAGSREQASGIEQINIAIGQMDQVTQQNAALVEEASAAAESLTGRAARLAQAVSVFKLEAA